MSLGMALFPLLLLFLVFYNYADFILLYYNNNSESYNMLHIEPERHFFSNKTSQIFLV